MSEMKGKKQHKSKRNMPAYKQEMPEATGKVLRRQGRCINTGDHGLKNAQRVWDEDACINTSDQVEIKEHRRIVGGDHAETQDAAVLLQCLL